MDSFFLSQHYTLTLKATIARETQGSAVPLTKHQLNLHAVEKFHIISLIAVVLTRVVLLNQLSHTLSYISCILFFDLLGIKTIVLFKRRKVLIKLVTL